MKRSIITIFLTIGLLLPITSNALVEDVFNVFWTINEKKEEIKKQETSKINSLKSIINSNKACIATVIISNSILKKQANKVLSGLKTVNNRIKFAEIHFKSENKYLIKKQKCNTIALIKLEKLQEKIK
jgi:hypothetical protein